MLNTTSALNPAAIRVKICGVTDPTIGRAAAVAGADAIGIVFYEKSPRAVSDLALARDIALSVGPFVTVVGLFVDPSRECVESVLEQVPLSLLQFHGREMAEFCTQFSRPYLKAIRMAPELDLEAAIAQHPNALGVLLDAYQPGVPGGTGETFDWARVPKQSPTPIVVAGGLNPDNVAEAVRCTRPWAVDVSGGVESSLGVKSIPLIESFIGNAKQAWQSTTARQS